VIEKAGPRMSAAGTVGLMARAVQKRTPSSGDHHTAIPELTIHRRNKSTQVVHCVYTLGMSITLQGSKHVLIGDKQLSYGPGQSILATIDLPISYHITRATAAEPYLGMMLKFDQSLLMQVASTLEKPREDKAMLTCRGRLIGICAVVMSDYLVDVRCCNSAVEASNTRPGQRIPDRTVSGKVGAKDLSWANVRRGYDE